MKSAERLTWRCSGAATRPTELCDGADATRLAIGAADDHPLSVPALTRQAIKRLQRTAAPAGKLACSSAADPQRRYHAQWARDYLHSLHLYSDPTPSF